MKNSTKVGLILSFAWCALVAFILFLAMTTTGCSPQRRLDRLYSRHPELFDRSNDTVILQDTVTVMIPGTAVDTFFHVRDLLDTVYLAKDNLEVMAYIRNDTLFMEAKTDTIFKTVTREIKVPYTRYAGNVKRPRDWLSAIGGIFLLSLACFVTGLMLSRRKKHTGTN